MLCHPSRANLMVIQWNLVIMNCWGPKHVHSKGGICHIISVGKSVQCSIGLGSEGVFVEFFTKYGLIMRLHCSHKNADSAQPRKHSHDP